MRLSMIAVSASALALVAADGASAQRMVTQGPGVATTTVGPGVGAGMNHGWNGTPMRGPGQVYNRPAAATASRWGSSVDGRWWAGANAPGGWNGYRRPHRGWTLPGYWNSSSFAIGDWGNYGLGAPPAGYGWTRYYDDAVLVDRRGRVYDNVGGVDWNRGGYAYDEAYGSGYAPSGYASSGYSGADYNSYTAPGYVQPTYGQSTYAPAPPAPPPYAAPAGYPAVAYAPVPAYAPGAGYPPPPAYVEKRSSGVGGALVGAGVGAVAGNLIGGRGHRLEGSLIGAGVGGVAGYAIDRSSTRRVPVAPGFAPGYGYAPPPPVYPAYAPPPPNRWHSSGGTVVTTSTGGYYGGGTTVVTVQTAPVVTTTTTEIVEDHVTYVRHPVVVHRKWVRRRPTCSC